MVQRLWYLGQSGADAMPFTGMLCSAHRFLCISTSMHGTADIASPCLPLLCFLPAFRFLLPIARVRNWQHMNDWWPVVAQCCLLPLCGHVQP